MGKRIDLVEGEIVPSLIKLALPIMGTSFLQMAYNMTDMFWLGRVGSDAVAAVGTAGFFMMLSNSLVMICKSGAEIKVAQSIGKGNERDTKSYIVNSIQVNMILAFIYGAIIILFNKPLIGFFKLGQENVVYMAETYLVIIALGMIVAFINPVFTAIFNGAGNSKTPFMINTLGLIANIVLDPLFIFGLGPIPSMGVAGAAIATVLAQGIVTLAFIISIKRSHESFFKFKLLSKMQWSYIKRLSKVGMPVALQNGLFTVFAMFIGRIIASWGPVPIAVQKVGSQIEAISWMTAGGFSTALGTFVGQNYGAKKYDRIFQGYKTTMKMALVVGVLASALLIFQGEAIFSLFIPEAEAIACGKNYLKILGYSQLFMCIEITTAGAFNGLGKTLIPSLISIIFTGLRVPAAYLLSPESVMGLDGIWWSISMSSVFKGVILTGTFLYLMKNKKDKLYNKDLVKQV